MAGGERTPIIAVRDAEGRLYDRGPMLEIEFETHGRIESIRVSKALWPRVRVGDRLVCHAHYVQDHGIIKHWRRLPRSSVAGSKCRLWDQDQQEER